ncbi:MAG: hypothetical protein IJR55_07620 [Clostridia bacterium]|nr:hypothetical protein [Clostridia bacterium]
MKKKTDGVNLPKSDTNTHGTEKNTSISASLPRVFILKHKIIEITNAASENKDGETGDEYIFDV